MEGLGGDGPSTSAAAALNQRRHEASKLFRYYLDKSTPHTLHRWIGTFVLVFVYALRIYYVQGFYIVVYGLGIYILNMLIGFCHLLLTQSWRQRTDLCCLQRILMNSSLSFAASLNSNSEGQIENHRRTHCGFFSAIYINVLIILVRVSMPVYHH